MSSIKHLSKEVDRSLIESCPWLKKKLPALSKMRFESLREGLSAQMMHIGPYSAEGPNIEKVHNFIRENGYELTGKHHEIYLSDPRKSAPEKMRTIIRQAIK